MQCDPAHLSFVEWNPFAKGVSPANYEVPIYTQQDGPSGLNPRSTNKQIRILFIFSPHCDLAPLSFVTFMLNGIRLSVCG